MPLRVEGPDVATGIKKPTKRKVVRKKKPPIPVPSLEASWKGPTPKPRPVRPAPPRPITPTMMDRKPPKPEPHGGHKPIKFLYEDPTIFHVDPNLEHREDRRATLRYNQQRERDRRAAARWDREQRKLRAQEIHKLPAGTRRMLGQKAINEYIQNGPHAEHPGVMDVLKVLGKKVLHGAPGLPGRIFEWEQGAVTGFQTHLGQGLRGRESPPEETPAWMTESGEILLGPNIMKAAAGEDFNPYMLAGELALLAVPMKGLPTPVTVALRALVGAKRLAAGERAGLTAAEIAETLTKPISEVKAGRRMRLLSEAADPRRAGPVPSSTLAGVLAGERSGRIAALIRNDVRATRKFKVGEGTIETPADFSRFGKGVRAVMDSIRDWPVIPLRSQATLGMRVIGKKAEASNHMAAGLMKELDNALPKNWRTDWPGVYAVRTVAKGVPIEEAIARTRFDMEQAKEAGDWLGEQALRVHLANFEAAKDRGYVVGAEFGPNAPPKLEELRKALEKVSKTREDILGRLEKLSDERARARILNEQLFYARAQALPQDDWVAQRLAAHPIRQRLEALWTKQNPTAAKQGMVLRDAEARRVYQNGLEYYDEEIDRLKAALVKHPEGDPLHDRHRIDLARLEAERASLDPGMYYDNIADISNVLPDEVVKQYSQEFGEFGRDWKFSMHEDMSAFEHELNAFSDDIAKQIHESGLPLPEELNTPEKLAAGIRKVFTLAHDGAAGADWYKTAADGVTLVSEHTGIPPKQVAQLFAIFSQAADTVANSTFVFDAIRQFQTHGDLFAGRFPVRQSEEALAVLKGGKWEGRKRSSFYANILRHIPGMENEYAQVIKEMAEERGAPIKHPVTVDRWVVRMFMPESKKDVPGMFYDSFETAIQQMAEKVGWEPEQIQAAAWVAMKDIGLKAEKRQTVRHLAGAEDAFQYGIQRQIEKEAQGDLFAAGTYTVRPQAKRLANQANKKWGGFTVDSNLKPVPEVGYVVTHSLTERKFPLHKLKGQDIEQFAEEYKAMLKDKRNVIGGFSDDVNEAGDGTEITYLSVSRQFKTKAAAMKFAREQGQETFYEYKTGDGIRTGLSRDEQAQIIRDLDPSLTKGGPVAAPPLTTEEAKYDKFLARAAQEFNISKKKVPTAGQKAQAEEWFLQHGDEYPNESIVQEWEALYKDRPQEELPSWLEDPVPPHVAQYRASLTGANLHAALFSADGSTQAGAGMILTGKGARLAKNFWGLDAAVAALERNEIPYTYIAAVADSQIHIYDKMAIAHYLDSVARAHGGQLQGMVMEGHPAVKRMFAVLQLSGMWEAETRKLYFSDEAHPIDWIHEFVHASETADAFPAHVKAAMWKHVGAVPGDKLTHDQSEDIADMVTSMVLGFDPEKSSLPDEVKTALAFVRDAMKASMKTGDRSFYREREMLAVLPEEERIFLEDIFDFDEGEAVHFTEGFAPPDTGQYVPEKLGLPFSFRQKALMPRRMATHWARLLGGKRITNLTPTDEHLTHAFKGDLLRSGRWGRSVVDGPLEGLLKAVQIQKMHDVHAKMLELGSPSPLGMADPVMIPVDPSAWTEKTRSQARSMSQILDQLDRGGTIDEMQLSRVDAQAIEAVKDYMFPGLTDASDVTEQIRQALQAPIEGVVWLPRDMLEQTGLFDSSIMVGSRALKYGLSGLDTVNNIMKMMTLSLNPAYYPMNAAGQLVMLGSQLQFSAPFSLARSLRQWRRMSEEDLALADAFAGIGFAGSFLSKGGLLQKATDTVGKVGTVVIDKYPRRAAFFHEARRLGYKTDEQMHALLNDIEHYDDLYTVHERTLRAMVDYGNLNRFEREALTRLIFVYPWLRGSSRYAAQFPFDHPIQAAMFAGLIYWQQNRLQKAFPEGHPGYMKWYLPVSIPVDGSGESPYGFRMDQLATPLQTLDLAAMMAYWGTGGRAALPWGSNEEGAASMLGPFAEEIEKTVSGYDSFTRQEVSHGIPDLFMRILDPRERWASWKRLDKIIHHETHTGIYDTTQYQNWLRLALGSLAPINVDPAKAGEQAAAKRGTPSASQNRNEWAKKTEEITGQKVPEEWVTWKANEQAFDKVSRRYRDEHGIEGDSTIQERLAMIIYTVAETRPDLKSWAEANEKVALAMDDDAAQSNYDSLREQLGLRQIGYVEGQVRKMQREQRTAP